MYTKKVTKTLDEIPGSSFCKEPTEKTDRKDNWDKQSYSTLCCATCHSYNNFRCRHNAPLGQAGWPAVFPTDWCMQHKMSKETMAKLQEERLR